MRLNAANDLSVKRVNRPAKRKKSVAVKSASYAVSAKNLNARNAALNVKPAAWLSAKPPPKIKPPASRLAANGTPLSGPRERPKNARVNCAVLNAGDGRHEHPTQALLDALTIRRRKGRLHRLTVAICGDIAHSRVARSNMFLLGTMENRVRLVGPPTLMPSGMDQLGVEVFDDMDKGLEGADVVMMLRLQKERMDGGFIPSEREYFHRFGLSRDRLAHAAPDAIVMHPGPMNRGVEIDGAIADDINLSVIQEQVEMGVAVRMAGMGLLAGP